MFQLCTSGDKGVENGCNACRQAVDNPRVFLWIDCG